MLKPRMSITPLAQIHAALKWLKMASWTGRKRCIDPGDLNSQNWTDYLHSPLAAVALLPRVELTDEQVERVDLDFVGTAAQRANELTEYRDPIYLSTLARLCYERGDLGCAVKWSRKAVDNLEGQPFFVGPPIRAALEDYETQAEAPAQDR